MAARKAPIHLGPGLTPRELAKDAVLRFVQALDEADEDLIRSAFTVDGILDLSGLSPASGPPLGVQEGIDSIVAGVLAHVGPMDSTHHLSNFRVKMNDTLDRAELTCYALAQHFRPGDGHDPVKKDYLLYGNIYWADVAKEGADNDSLWRIKRIEPKIKWVEGDPGVGGR